MALVIALRFAREAIAGPYEYDIPGHYYAINVCGGTFGFVDDLSHIDSPWSSLVCLGPLGNHSVPFSATQGLIGFCVILATLIILPAVLTVRWKKKQTAA